MDFGLSEDQSIFQEALRRYLAERVPLERVRATMESESGVDRALVTELAAQGVNGVLAPEANGGSALGMLDAAVAAEELGAAAAPLSFHSACVMAPLALALAGSEAQKAEWLTPAAAGQLLLSFACDAPVPCGGKLWGSAVYVPDAETADAFVVCAGEGDARELLVLPCGARGLHTEALATVDDTRRVGELVFDGVAVDESMKLDADAKTIDRILDAGRIALAADALGASERALERAVAYSQDRKQFERVIGSFQAVKHMCAEAVADIEPVRSLLWYAAFAWDEWRDDAATMAAMVKAHATEVATSATTACVQVFGGMGFTYECDVHIWFKRAGYDRQMLGGPAELRARSLELTLG